MRGRQPIAAARLVGRPAGTKSFAVTAYDPDAPTGSGWWHWNVVNIPASIVSLQEGASGQETMPKAAQELTNDYGAKASVELARLLAKCTVCVHGPRAFDRAG